MDAYHRDIKKELSSLLKGVNSIGRLKKDTLRRLVCLEIDTISIDKFYVAPDEYLGWAYVHRELCESFDYDAVRQRLIIKCQLSIPRAVLTRWVTGPVYSVIEQFKGKEFCQQLTANKWTSPIIYFYHEQNLRNDDDTFDYAKMRVAYDHARLVVMILSDIVNPHVDEFEDAMKNFWGLDPSKAIKMGQKNIARHIINWHKEHNYPIVDYFRFNAFLWSNRREKECILNHPMFPSDPDFQKEVNNLEEPTVMLDELIDLDDPAQNTEFTLPLREMMLKFQDSLEDVVEAWVQTWADDTLRNLKEGRKAGRF